MKIVCTYEIEVTYEDDDITKEELLAMSEDELYNYANDLKDYNTPISEEPNGMTGATFYDENEEEITYV